MYTRAVPSVSLRSALRLSSSVSRGVPSSAFLTSRSSRSSDSVMYTRPRRVLSKLSSSASRKAVVDGCVRAAWMSGGGTACCWSRSRTPSRSTTTRSMC
eukprot:5610970-Pleurochrysis_carterae.AAC.1